MNKRIKGTVVGALVVLIIGVIFMMPAISQKFQNTNKEEMADGYLIDSFDIEMEVFRNNTVNIKENITVLWTEDGHHGIYRVMPTWLKYTNKNRRTMSRKMDIGSMSSSEAYGRATMVGKNKWRLKMGSPYSTSKAGSLHTYTVNYYGCDFGKDPYIGYDEFIFHAYGDYLGTQINNPSIKITMPEKINNLDIKFFADKFRRQDITQYVDYKIDGNTIMAKVKQGYPLYKALTVDIVLPDGYFRNAKNIYNNSPIMIMLLIIIIQIVLLTLLPIIGKNHPKVSNTNEYSPPDNLDPAQIGYIYKNGEAGPQLISALLVSIASKGYIRIDKDFIDESIGDEKIKKLSGSLKNKYVAFNLYLEPGKTYRNPEGIPIPKGTTYTPTNKLKPLSECEKFVYKGLFENEDVNILTDNTTLYALNLEIEKMLRKETDPLVNDTTSTNVQIFSIWTCVFSILIMLFVYYFMEGINPKYSAVYFWAWLASFASVLPAIFMGRKTKYGEQITARINGYRTYLENVKKEELDSLVEKNPEFYYDILPYAYVLGISTVWIDKFKDSIIPEEVKRRYGTIDYYNYNIFYNIDRELRNGIYKGGGSSSGGGCSSCGGGCSSCGGGCSSCGGGGSW